MSSSKAKGLMLHFQNYGFPFVELTYFSSTLLFFPHIDKGERLHNLKTTDRNKPHSHAEQTQLPLAEMQTDPSGAI